MVCASLRVLLAAGHRSSRERVGYGFTGGTRLRTHGERGQVGCHLHRGVDRAEGAVHPIYVHMIRNARASGALLRRTSEQCDAGAATLLRA
eukprot:5012605-Prymnesium_polylepis.2